MLTPPFLLKGQKRLQGRRLGEPRPDDHPQHVRQVLDDLSNYIDCVYEILARDFGKKKWTRNLGIPHPRDLAMRELFGFTSGVGQILKDLEVHRSNLARERKRRKRIENIPRPKSQ